MNKRLEEAVARVMALPDAQQGEIADLLIDVLEQDSLDIQLTPEQVAEIEQALHESVPTRAMPRSERCSTASPDEAPVQGARTQTH